MEDSMKLGVVNGCGALAVAAVILFLYCVVGSVEYAAQITDDDWRQIEALRGCSTDAECERLEAYVQAHRGAEGRGQ